VLGQILKKGFRFHLPIDITTEQVTMSDSIKNNTEAQETEYAVKPSKRARTKRHCLRFWWAYLIALICIVVLVVCLM
jgi:t-SNARE complex subunit (syntaxin)